MAPKQKAPPTEELVELCKPFELNDEHLKELMVKFNEDINLGLGKATHADSIVKCFITYVQDLPNGKEKGKFLALDLGGTNFRVLVINLSEKHFDMKSKIYAIPQPLMVGPGRQLFDHIAECLFNFCKEHKLLSQKLPLGFTFSFPLIQKGLSVGILERWTKGFNCTDIIGQDVVKLLEESIAKRGDILIDVTAVLNDTTGTLMSCAWKNHNTKIGLIIGTGTNSCYVEKIENAELFEGDKSKPYVIINTESGAFGDDGKLDFIRTEWDLEVDRNTINPGRQLHEKMISGMYMGELARLILVDAAKKNLMFDGKITDKLNKRDEFNSKYVSDVERNYFNFFEKTESKDVHVVVMDFNMRDKPGSYSNVKKVLKDLGYASPSDQDCANVRYVCECVSRRGGNMVSASMATLLNRMQFENVTIGVDGSLFRFHPGFQDLMTKKIRELADPKIKFNLMLSEDGSGRGAALVAAVAARDKPT